MCRHNCMMIWFNFDLMACFTHSCAYFTQLRIVGEFAWDTSIIQSHVIAIDSNAIVSTSEKNCPSQLLLVLHIEMEQQYRYGIMRCANWAKTPRTLELTYWSGTSNHCIQTNCSKWSHLLAFLVDMVEAVAAFKWRFFRTFVLQNLTSTATPSKHRYKNARNWNSCDGLQTDNGLGVNEWKCGPGRDTKRAKKCIIGTDERTTSNNRIND